VVKYEGMHKNRVTQSIIIGIVALLSAASWSGLKGVLYGYGSWTWPAYGFLVLLVALSLSWVLSKSRTILSITFAFALVSFLLIFGLRLEYLAALVVAVALFAIGSFRAVNEKEVRIKLHAHKVVRKGMPFVLTGLALLIASAYYFSPLAQQGQDQIKIPRPLFNIVIKPVLLTVEQELDASEIAEQFGITVEGTLTENKQLEEVLYLAVNAEINKYTRDYKEYFPLGLAVGMFLTIKAIGLFFGWLTILLSWLIFRLLVISGAVKIQEKAVLKEEIQI